MADQPKHIVIDNRMRRTSTGRYSDRLVEHLQDIDPVNRYTILLQPDDPWQPRAGNFSSVPCPFPQFSYNVLTELQFSSLIYKLKPDLVHFVMTQQPLLYFGNIVTTSHDTTMYHFVRRGSTPLPVYKLKMGMYKFLVWWSHRKSKKIIVPTHTVAKEFAEIQPFIKDKLVVTYESSEPPIALPAQQPASVDTDNFILYVGTAFPHKNLPKLIEAFDLLFAKNPSLKLVLAGKREKHYEELQEWAKNHSSYQNIVFAGYVSDQELKWLYEHCRAYVFASLSEGFGLPPLEAMSHGAPVVSSNASCMPEVYGDAALYFDATNPQDIAGKVNEVLTDNTLRSDLIQKGHTQLKKYSWERMAQQTFEVYKSLLDK